MGVYLALQEGGRGTEVEQAADEGLIVRQELGQFGVGQHAAVDVDVELLRRLIGRFHSVAVTQVLADVVRTVHAVSVAVGFVHGLRLLQVL